MTLNQGHKMTVTLNTHITLRFFFHYVLAAFEDTDGVLCTLRCFLQDEPTDDRLDNQCRFL